MLEAIKKWQNGEMTAVEVFEKLPLKSQEILMEDASKRAWTHFCTILCKEIKTEGENMIKFLREFREEMEC